MKIARAQVHLAGIDGRRPLILRLWTDEGLWGLGEAALAYGVGASGAAEIAAIAEMRSMRVQPHLCAGPVATAAALQLDACIPNFLIQELCPFRVPAHRAPVDAPLEPQVRSGRLAIPDQPGHGIDLVQERVAPFLRAGLPLGH